MTNYGSDSRDRMEEQSVTSRLLVTADDSTEIADIPTVKSRWPAAVLSIASLVCIVVVSIFLLDGTKTTKTFETGSQNVLQSSSRSFAVRATNEYGYYDGSKYPWMSDISGTQLVEPYKSTLLTLNGLAASDEFSYSWTIANENGLTDKTDFVNQTKNSNTLSVVFQNAGIYSLNVLLTNSTGAVKYSYSTRLVCKYVKRELRALNTVDREAFLDAAIEIWNNRQEAGVAKYGSKFTSVDTLVAVHSLASNDIMCDGFHEGSGFITHHLALTNTFEAALRSVNPAVTLPYWDFTIEGEAIRQANKPPSYMLEITPVFSKDWFGDTDLVSNRIVTSRWAGSKMPKNELEVIGVQNSYGYIRSYWNNNPDAEVSRHLFDTCGVEPLQKHIPACSEHYAVLNASKLGSFQLLSPADGHGPMHVQIGGVWGGCVQAYKDFSDKWASVLDQNMTDAEIAVLGFDKWKWGNTAVRRNMVETSVIGEYFHIYRSFWRSHMCAVDGKPHYLVCPESCDESVPFESCTCKVEALVNGNTTWQNLFPCLLNTELNRDYFTAVMPEELISDLVYMVATASVQEGEMVESASTADIMFWLTHPAIERMLSAKRLPAVTTMGSKEISKWPVVSGNNETWLEFSYYSFEKGVNAGFPDMAYRCSGHGKDDVALTGNLTYTDAISSIIDLNKDGIASNWEYFIAMDPNNMYGNDYVWDHFNWDHCA